MNIHRLSENIKAIAAFNVAITAAATNGATVDTLGFRRAAAVVNHTPSGALTTSDVKLQESSDSFSADTADVTGATFTQATTVGGNKVQVLDIDLAPRKRYLRLVHTGAGASAAGQATGVFLLFEPGYAAVTQPTTAVSV